MTGRRDRMPGDPAPVDERFGPLGGLVDDVHQTVHGGDRARDVDGALRLRAPDRERGLARGLRARLMSALERVRGAG
jgi:hypothetical protein